MRGFRTWTGRMPEFIRSTTEIVAEVLRQELCCRDPEASEVALAVAEALADQYGGEVLYIPKMQHQTLRRHREICEAYDGTNVLELAETYDLSRQQVQKIVRMGLNEGWIEDPQQDLGFDG